MFRRTSFTKVESSGSATPDAAASSAALLSLLFLTAWCGLVAGLLEVGTIVLRKHTVDPDRLYKLNRFFAWLIPLSNVGVFLVLGILGCGVIVVWPRYGRWLYTRALCALMVLPSVLVAFPGSTAWRGWRWRLEEPRGSSQRSSEMSEVFAGSW